DLGRGLAGERARADQAAGGLDLVADQRELGLDGDGARLVSVELEWGEELNVLDGLEPPAEQEQDRGLGEGLDAHDAGQDRLAIDLVVEEEGLALGIERGLDDEASGGWRPGSIGSTAERPSPSRAGGAGSLRGSGRQRRVSRVDVALELLRTNAGSVTPTASTGFFSSRPTTRWR